MGKGYQIQNIICANYFYPLGTLPFAASGADISEPDGLTGEVTPIRRPLKEGETMEWVLLSGVSPGGGASG